jgi:hypothetical protein
MPVPKAKAIISNDIESSKVYIADVTLTPDKDAEKKVGDYTVELPYIIHFSREENGEAFQANPTSKYLKAKKWSSKFYISQSGFTNYTRDQDLLALVTVFQKAGELKKEDLKDFDINSIIGMSFDAVVSGSKKAGYWINWTETFELHGIRVPDLKQELVAQQKMQAEVIEDKPVEKKEPENNEAQIILDAAANDLPF